MARPLAAVEHSIPIYMHWAVQISLGVQESGLLFEIWLLFTLSHRRRRGCAPMLGISGHWHHVRSRLDPYYGPGVEWAVSAVLELQEQAQKAIFAA